MSNVDGDSLLGMLDKLDSWEVVATYFEDISVAESRDAKPSENSKSVFGKLRSWVK